jgi:hypothetical protein
MDERVERDLTNKVGYAKPPKHTPAERCTLASPRVSSASRHIGGLVPAEHRSRRRKIADFQQAALQLNKSLVPAGWRSRVALAVAARAFAAPALVLAVLFTSEDHCCRAQGRSTRPVQTRHRGTTVSFGIPQIAIDAGLIIPLLDSPARHETVGHKLAPDGVNIPRF